MSDRRDVTGIWYGRWSSSNGYVPANSFIATLEEHASIVGGSVTERDQRRPGIIRSIVDGVRAGSRIEFTKQYDGSGRLSHAVYYSGTIDSAGTEIRGAYRFSGYSGDFVMTREKFDADELEETGSEEIRVPEKID